MSEDQGLVDKVPTDVWLAYDKRATDYAAMHGNGSAALKAGILRLTLDAWLAGSLSHPSSKLGDATQKTGQSAENAEGAGSSPAGRIAELEAALQPLALLELPRSQPVGNAGIYSLRFTDIRLAKELLDKE